MRVSVVLRMFLMLFLAGGVMVLLPGIARAAAPPASDLLASIDTSGTSQPKLLLKNSSARDCQVVASALGTTAITKVVQNGKSLPAAAANFSFIEPLDYTMKQQFKTLRPGESVSIPLAVNRTSAGTLLQSVTWSEGGGEFGSRYTIDPKQPLKLELTYAIPVTPAQGAPVCSGVAFANTVAGKSRVTLRAGLVGVFICIVLLVIAVWFWRRRKQSLSKGKKAAGGAAAALVAFALASFLLPAPRASAQIHVPADLQPAWDACMARLEANRDITGPALDVLNDPSNETTVTETNMGTESSGTQHLFFIYWNPNESRNYYGTGGPVDPCDSLYHEMYHLLEIANGTLDVSDCAGSGIAVKEVNATRAQNALRERFGLPPRSHYGDRALPSGDCTAPAPPRCEGAHCGDTNGDPHLRTFDGLRYDFQAVGEFTVARSHSGDFEVQARQQPWTGSRYVSLNTAIAMRLDGDKIEMRASQKAPLLLVNGKPAALKDTTFPGGGSLKYDESGVAVLTWKDGSTAWIRPVGGYGLHLALEPSDALAGKVEGLLGDADGKTANDLHLRGKTAAVKPVFKELYPAFADSWRITDQTSLFTYDKGKNTASYTDKSFPDPDPPALRTLPGYAAAELFCKNLGITDETILQNCITDIALTGQSAFGRAAANSQALTANGAFYAAKEWTLTVKDPDGTATTTFDAAAGDKVYIDVVRSSLPSQCGTLRLLAPDNTEVANGCIINHTGNIDGTVLPQAGTYTVVLKPGGSTGSAELRLYRVKDKTGQVTADGKQFTADIDKPGVTGRYTFTGKAGQLIYIAIPKSKLPSQCGSITLQDSAGHTLKDGCIINGVGDINTTVLPADGQYTFVLDANDAGTGKSEVRIYTATGETKSIGFGDSRTFTLNIPGSSARFTFQGTAGRDIFVDIPHSDLPSQCGILYLLAPDGSSVGSGCVINHKGNLSSDAVRLPQSGTYTIVFDPADAVTGTTTLTLR